MSTRARTVNKVTRGGSLAVHFVAIDPALAGVTMCGLETTGERHLVVPVDWDDDRSVCPRCEAFVARPDVDQYRPPAWPLGGLHHRWVQ